MIKILELVDLELSDKCGISVGFIEIEKRAKTQSSSLRLIEIRNLCFTYNLAKFRIF